ncbi:MAG: putative phytochrome sensor protein [Gammaproteobacteria bacterium]|nr:putative phytochrome sensor protein [Gammaproteobacteria bacterium]
MNGPGQVSGTRSVLLTVIIVVAVLRLAKDVFIPLALAILLTFLLAPLVARLAGWGINRLLAVIVSMAIALTLVGSLADLGFNQFADLARELPGYQRQLHQNLTHIRGAVRGGVADASKAVEQLGRELQRVAPGEPLPSSVGKVQVIEAPATPLKMVRDFFGPVLKPFGTAVVVIVLVAFMLLRLHDLRERIISVLGRRNLYATTKALNDAAQRVSRYLLMQLAINTWTGIWVGLGLWFLDVPNPGLWGALALVLRFIPYLGVWAAGVLPFALSFAVSDDLSRPLLVFGLFAVLEFLNYAVFEPWLFANQTGISPVALLLGAAFWAWLWGGVGLFLAVPMTVCVAVMSKYIPQLGFLLVLLGDEPVLEPHQRLYQRLLAANRDGADSLLEDTLRSKSMLEACDAVIVPAIRLLEADYDRRALGAAKRKTVLEHVDQWVQERLDALDTLELREQGKSRSIGANAPWILCVPAADRADEIVAKLLAAALLECGIGAAFVTPEALDKMHLDENERTVDAAVVSALPPEAVAPARAVCRRVRGGTRELPLVVGLWDPEDDLLKPRQRLEAAGADRVVVTFAECVAAIEGLRVRPESPALPAPRPQGTVLQT